MPAEVLQGETLNQYFGIQKTTVWLVEELHKTHKIVLYSDNEIPERFKRYPNVYFMSFDELNNTSVENGVCLLTGNGLLAMSPEARYYTLYKFNGKCPIVPIIHDTIYDVFGLSHGAIHRWIQESIDIASLIITPSAHSAKDIKKYYDTNKDVEVLYWGVSIEEKKREPKQFYLYVGGFNFRKGVDTLIDALIYLLNNGRKINCVLIGHNPDKIFEKKIRMVEHTGLAQIAPAVSQETLVQTYAAAKALIYPTLYEGFGLPIVEAMRLRCPVITCRNSSIPEVSGDFCLYTEEENHVGLAERILDIEDSRVDITSIIHDGYEYSKRFLWKDNIKKFTDVLNRVSNQYWSN